MSRDSIRTVARKSSKGSLRLCGGLDIPTNLRKIPLMYNVSYFNLGGLRALFGGVKPIKAPHGDGIVLNHKGLAKD